MWFKVMVSWVLGKVVRANAYYKVLSKVYALGFMSNLDKSPHLFYLKETSVDQSSEELILLCLDNMLKYIKITMVDSFNLLSNSLDKLSKDFKVETEKGYFPIGILLFLLFILVCLTLPIQHSRLAYIVNKGCASIFRVRLRD